MVPGSTPTPRRGRLAAQLVTAMRAVGRGSRVRSILPRWLVLITVGILVALGVAVLGRVSIGFGVDSATLPGFLLLLGTLAAALPASNWLLRRGSDLVPGRGSASQLRRISAGVGLANLSGLLLVGSGAFGSPADPAAMFFPSSLFVIALAIYAVGHADFVRVPLPWTGFVLLGLPVVFGVLVFAPGTSGAGSSLLVGVCLITAAFLFEAADSILHSAPEESADPMPLIVPRTAVAGTRARGWQYGTPDGVPAAALGTSPVRRAPIDRNPGPTAPSLRAPPSSETLRAFEKALLGWQTELDRQRHDLVERERRLEHRTPPREVLEVRPAPTAPKQALGIPVGAETRPMVARPPSLPPPAPVAPAPAAVAPPDPRVMRTMPLPSVRSPVPADVPVSVARVPAPAATVVRPTLPELSSAAPLLPAAPSAPSLPSWARTPVPAERTAATQSALDVLFEGLGAGTTVALLSAGGTPSRSAIDRFLLEGLRNGGQALLVTFRDSPADVTERLERSNADAARKLLEGSLHWIDGSEFGGPELRGGDGGGFPADARPPSYVRLLARFIAGLRELSLASGPPLCVVVLGASVLLRRRDYRVGYSFLRNVGSLVRGRNALAVLDLDLDAPGQAPSEPVLSRVDRTFVVPPDGSLRSLDAVTVAGAASRAPPSESPVRPGASSVGALRPLGSQG